MNIWKRVFFSSLNCLLFRQGLVKPAAKRRQILPFLEHRDIQLNESKRVTQAQEFKPSHSKKSAKLCPAPPSPFRAPALNCVFCFPGSVPSNFILSSPEDIYFFIAFREERKERQTDIDVRETSIGCLLACALTRD